ncbi:MAG TPA: hypothetical protein VFI31_23515 [Pirellulales bacterium]|nr:hypothetical protein [Pirellulales bacterium]
MTRVTLDAQTLNKLLGLAQPLDVCDESGNVLGIFTPLSERERAERARPPLTVEELARRRSEPGYSTAELLAHLEKL